MKSNRILKGIIPLFIFFIFFISFTYSFSTSIDNSFQPLETAVITITTNLSIEKFDPYFIVWSNGTNNLKLSNGTLSGTLGGNVFETYNLPDNTCTTCYVNTTSNGISIINYFNITGNSIYNLEVNNGRFSPEALLGKTFAVNFRVRDSVTMNQIDNAVCTVYGTDNNQAPLQECGEVTTHAGSGICQGNLDNQIFKENTQYLAKIRCSCGIGDNACFDSLGNTVEKKHGEITYVFEVSPWIKVNTITDKSSYVLEDKEVLVCANITNFQNERLSLEIVYNYRCNGNNNDTDRLVYDVHTELRGISANTTQNQCANLEIKNLKSIANKEKECYAATDVRVLTKSSEEVLFTYPTTSNDFIISSDSSIIYGEDIKMYFFNFTVYAVLTIIAIIFMLMIHLFKEDGISMSYGFISGVLFFFMFIMLLAGFKIVSGISFIVDINYYFMIVYLALAVYCFTISYFFYKDNYKYKIYDNPYEPRK